MAGQAGKIIDYITVGGRSSDFDDRVKDLIKDGWEPIGGVAVVNYAATETEWFYQAMVKRGE